MKNIMYCKCGCNNKLPFPYIYYNGKGKHIRQYINGHNTRGIKRSAKTKKKISITCLTRRNTEKFKRNLSNVSKKRWTKLEYRLKMSNLLRDLWKTKKYRTNVIIGLKKAHNKKSESFKRLWSTKEYSISQAKAMGRKPNKLETVFNDFLQKIVPSKYKYVGNGDFWIERFNPDFINEKNKKIIELFGDYWHNLPKAIKKDKLRLSTYSKYGYDTLVIWESDFKNNLFTISKTILNFNRR